MRINRIALVSLLLCLSISMAGCKGNRDKKVNNDNETKNKIEVVIDDATPESTIEENDETTQNIDKGILYSDYQKNRVDSKNTLMEAPTKEDSFLIPMLQNPTENGVYVQWFTAFEGEDNQVLLFEDVDPSETIDDDNLDIIPTRTFNAETFKLSRLRGGTTEKDCNDPKISSDIYKHVAYIDNLPEYNGYMSERVKYCISTNGEKSDIYTLSAKAKEGTPLRVLLTSDFQIKKMCAANYQKVYETIGNVDAIFFDGDIVDVPDRQYDWFFADNAFFRVMTGSANHTFDGKTYYGAPLVQEAPIYTAIGNHDVMGVYDEKTDLSVQFNNPLPDNFNTITYEEMFELPTADNSERYYATNIGDISLISMCVARVWRLPNVGLNGKYSEIPGANADKLSHGDFIFEPVDENSKQIKFLEKSLQSESYVNSKYKVVMFHSEAHSLGDNALPAFTDPEKRVVIDPGSGQDMIIYNYPTDKDYINTVIEPLLKRAGTNLLFNAHSHLWNRFVTDNGMNVLQTSNVGNTYGAYMEPDSRSSIPSALSSTDSKYAVHEAFNESYYPKYGDVYGLTPVSPNIEALPEDEPYLASNSITAFSILDTGKGTVDSYYFDTAKADSEVVLFDSFEITN